MDCFSKNKSSKDGLKDYCKACAAVGTKKYRERHREEINARKRAEYERQKAQKEERTQKELLKGDKVCSVCGKKKPLSEYYPRGNGGFYARCKQCEQKAQKAERDANPEKVKAQKKKYNRERKQKIDDYNRLYAKTHSKENVERAKKWKEDNPEKSKELRRQAQQKRNARKKGLPYSLTIKEWEQCKAFFTDADGLHCAYCGKVLKRATQEHVIPVAKGGAYTKGNIVPACRSCNTSKSTKDVWEWFKEQNFYSPEREEEIRDYLKLSM